MEVGAGHREVSVWLLQEAHADIMLLQLRSLAGALAPALRAIRQQEYYVNPRFHASIAWALLSRSEDTLSLESNVDCICIPSAESEDSISSPTSTPGDGAEAFPTISHLPPELITSLTKRYSARLASPHIGVFDVEKVIVKIGKEITSWRLLGM